MSESSQVMSLGDRPLAHRGFVGVLSTLSEDTPAWTATMAGFLTLRLIDKWDAATDGALPPTPREVQAVRRAVFAVETVPLRRFLAQIVEAVSESWGQRTRAVLATVLAYAYELQNGEQWALAADAFEIIVTYARTADEMELVPNSYLKLGFCLQTAGRPGDADRAFETARVMGESGNDHRLSLHARVGLAVVMRHRGNLPAAEVALDAVVAEAERIVGRDGSSAVQDVLVLAMHVRGTIAYLRNDHERAAVLYHEALSRAQTEDARERLLSDAATNLADMGLHDSARDALMVLHLTATTRWSRLVAASNLMYFAQLRGIELEFEHYRRELADADLPARVEGFYYLTSGQGLSRFGRVDAARTALNKAIDVARKYSLNETLLTAETALDHLERGVRTTPARATESAVPQSVAHIVKDVRRLRETVGAGA